MSQRGAFVLGPDLTIAQVLGADMASGSQIRQFRHRLVLRYLRESGNCLASCSVESSLIALRLGPYGGEHEHIAHPPIQGAPRAAARTRAQLPQPGKPLHRAGTVSYTHLRAHET